MSKNINFKFIFMYVFFLLTKQKKQISLIVFYDYCKDMLKFIDKTTNLLVIKIKMNHVFYYINHNLFCVIKDKIQNSVL